MYKLKVVTVLITVLLSACVWASELSMDTLSGEWEFLHWAEKETPEQTHKVGIVMDFKSDGTVLSEVGDKSVAEAFRIEGDTIIYTGKRGDQNWKLVSFVPGESMVVDNSGSIMTFRKK